MLLIFGFSLVIVLSKTLITDSIFTTQKQGQNWSKWLAADQQIGNFSKFFLCAVSFQQMVHTVSLQNCNCKRRWHRGRKKWRCQHCDTVYTNKASAFKATYCNHNDWNQKIVKQFNTANTDSGRWRQVKCPPEQYASKVSVRLSNEQGTYIGFNGIQIKCSDVNLKESTTVYDDYTFQLSEQSNNENGTFISGIQIKYQQKGMMTGARFSFEGIPVISNISMAYETVQNISPTATVIESAQFSNLGSISGKQKVKLNNTFLTRNKWTNQAEQEIYQIPKTVKVSPLYLSEEGQQYSIYSKKDDFFTFDKQIQTIYQPPTQQMIVVLLPCQKVVVTSVIREQNVSVPYKATITFVKKINGSFIGSSIVKGDWKGVMTSTVKTSFVYSTIQNCPQISTVNNYRIDVSM